MSSFTLFNIKKTVIYFRKNFIRDNVIIVFGLIGIVASLALKLLVYLEVVATS